MTFLHKDGTLPRKGEIFVFGSNTRGIHGKGAALVARLQFGAIQGMGRGPMGQAYAIPTKDGFFETRSLGLVRGSIQDFLTYARDRRDQKFFVTRIGCGLANFKDEEIAPLFHGAPDNCSFAVEWSPWLCEGVVLTRERSHGNLRGMLRRAR